MLDRGGADILVVDRWQTRQRSLAQLSERLRSCDTPVQISAAVAELLGSVLHCSRAGYATIIGDYTSVEADWSDGTLDSLTGRHEFSVLGPRYVEHMRRGQILVVPDVCTHPVMAEGVDLWLSINVRALLNVPLREAGVCVAMVYAHQTTPRDWTADEISLMQEIADRTWEAIGRARAVESLRRMNETLETQIRERTLQRDRMWTLSTDLMMVTNRDRILLAVNPAWTRLLGWREEELVGLSFFNFLHPDDFAATQAQRVTLEKGHVVERFENRFLAKNGKVVWLSWKAIPDGDVVHSVGRDVTADREHALALKEAEEALRQAQKMEAVGQLTGGIAHDFNNLLQGILGALQLSEKRIAQGRLEDLAKYNAQAQQCVQRATALTHRLLAFSRRQPLDPKPVQANELILAMEPLLLRTLGESIKLEFDLAADIWPTLCDPNQLDSAILNLTINARDAMPDGGAVTIRSRNMPDPDGDKISLSVTDTGTGMAPDVLARAFDPFYTTKAIGQGTGLGLSMVYGFMRQSGGEARIASEVGVGTTVSLYLKRYAGPITAASEVSAQAGGVQGEGTVLVLEDEPAVRGFVTEILQQLGFLVIEAKDGSSGLEILQSSQRIDLLVTDIGLPGLNGRQLAEAARQMRPSLKVLFMTGYAEAAAMSEGFLLPGMGLIAKPFSIEALAARIAQLGRP